VPLAELIFLKGVIRLFASRKTNVFEPNDIVDSSEKFLEAEESIPRSPWVTRLAVLWVTGALLCAICVLLLVVPLRLFRGDHEAMRVTKSVVSNSPHSKSAEYDKLEPIDPAAAGSPHAIVVGQARSTEARQVPSNPQGERVTVASVTNIRGGPSASAPVIGLAHAGAEAEVAARDSEWVQIMDPASSKTGWIHSKFLVPATVETPATTGDGGQAELPQEQVDASVGSLDENATLPTEPEPSVKPNKSRKHGWRNRHRRGLAIRLNLRRLW
jgi:uncharacterized protein YraI